MSRKHLETILSCETLPLNEMELFQSVCRWAEHQCQQKRIESTGENFREVLGSCLREIRFPTMNFEDFTEISAFKRNLFTAEEIVATFQFIGTDEDRKVKFDKSQLSFITKPRNSFGCSVLRLPKQFKITQNPPFVCDGYVCENLFQVNQKISLHGVGFLGPIGGDTHFDVTVQIKRYANGSYPFDSGTLKKNIFARKGNIFYFLFNAPITIEPNSYSSKWENFYSIIHSLKGANHLSTFKVENPKHESVQIFGVEFHLFSGWNNAPLAELLFKKN